MASMPIPRLSPGATLTLDFVNRLIDEVNALKKFSVGPGLALYESTAGRVISLAAQPPQVFGSSKEDNSGGTLKTLAHVQGTQDTDTWSATGDLGPLTLTILTDFKYDTTNHQFTYRTRTLTFDKGGNLRTISAESDPVLVTTAEACT